MTSRIPNNENPVVSDGIISVGRLSNAAKPVL
jgi:hypothetical protein